MNHLIDRAAATEHLKLAERHVVEGRRRVDAQVSLLARLEGNGRPVEQAKMLLRELQATLALHVQSRDRIARELREGI